MDKTRSIATLTDKLYIAGYLICLLAFIVPANSISLGGQAYTQYLLTSYTGWIILGVLLVLFSLQWFALLRNNKWLCWTGLIAGLYSFTYAAITIAKGYERFSTSMADSLVNKLQAKNIALAGLWLLAAGGALLFTIALFKIIKHRRATMPVFNAET